MPDDSQNQDLNKKPEKGHEAADKKAPKERADYADEVKKDIGKKVSHGKREVLKDKVAVEGDGGRGGEKEFEEGKVVGKEADVFEDWKVGGEEEVKVGREEEVKVEGEEEVKAGGEEADKVLEKGEDEFVKGEGDKVAGKKSTDGNPFEEKPLGGKFVDEVFEEKSEVKGSFDSKIPEKVGNNKIETEVKQVEGKNPFEADMSAEAQDQFLPPKEHEKRYKEEITKESVRKKKKDVEDVDAVKELKEEEKNPFDVDNPFDTIEKRAFDGTVLDKKDKEVKKVEKEVAQNKDVSPEEKGEAKESLQFSPDDFGKGGEKAVGVDDEGDEDDFVDDDVIDVEGESVSAEVAPQVVEGVGAGESKVSEKQNVEVFKSEGWDILEQAGITKRRVSYFFVILGVSVFIFLFFIFGWYKFFGIGNNDDGLPKDESVVENIDMVKDVGGDEKVTEESSVVEGVEEISAVDVIEGGVVNSYIFGLKDALKLKSGDVNGIDLAFLKGMDGRGYESLIGYHNDVLKRMDNYYNTDIYALLNMSVDRRGALTTYLTDLKSLIVEAQTAYDRINVSLAEFDAEFERVAGERDVYEQQFFTEVEALNGHGSYEKLESFINSSQEATRIKAYYTAYKSLGSMFLNSLEALNPRYEDVLANTEALIKGVKVFDIPGSDINAIIRLESP